MDLIDRQAAIDASESEKQTLKELMIKYGFSAPDMTVTEFVEDILPSAHPEPCEDAVSRKAVIDEIEYEIEMIGKTLDSITLDFNARERLRQRRGEAREILNSVQMLPSVHSEQRWIPCSERLPEEGHDVLITKEPFKIKGYEQEVIKAKRSVDPRSGEIEWWSPEFGTLTNKAVLAWMSLPEPYRAESEEV